MVWKHKWLSLMAAVVMVVLMAACEMPLIVDPNATAPSDAATTAPEAATAEMASSESEAGTPSAEATAAESTEPTFETADETAEVSGDEADAAETTGEESTATPEPETGADEATVEEVTPRVFFRQPTDNAIIPPVSTVIMGVEGLTVEPSGVVNEGAGHMHLLIDRRFSEPGEVIPNDETHLHFGDGSTQTLLTLEPGLHILRLQFADGEHTALEGEQYRAEIVVRVAEDAPDQAVRFVTPTDGAVVPPTFELVMAATGLIVEPAGAVEADAGHLHVLVDADFVEPGQGVPKDEQHLHFGAGQTTVEMNLEPGEHTLRLQFADGEHTALAGDQYRDEITVTVDPDAPARQVMFVTPQDGETVDSPVAVKWAANGLIIEPAGINLVEGRGHLHLLIDSDFIEPDYGLPMDEQHLHFGGGQTETELTLEPGEHTLRLQMANGTHMAMAGDEYRDEITITVK